MASNLSADTRTYYVPTNQIMTNCSAIGKLTEAKIYKLTNEQRYYIGKLTKANVGQEVGTCSPTRYFIFNAINGIRSESYHSMDDLKRNEILPSDIWSAERISKMRELFDNNNPDVMSDIEVAKSIGMLTTEKIESLSERERRAITTYTKRCIVEFASTDLIPKQYALVNTANGLKSKTYDSRQELVTKEVDIDRIWTREQLSYKHLLFSITTTITDVAYNWNIIDKASTRINNGFISTTPLVPDECFKSKEHIKFKDRNRSIDIHIDPEIKF